MERKKAQSQPKKKTVKTCGNEPFDLRSKVSNLEKTLKNQEKVIKGMYKHLNQKDDKENINDVSEYEIGQAKKSMHELKIENAHLKKIIDGKDSYPEDKEKDLLRSKLCEYESLLREKDLLLEEKDRFYKSQTSSLTQKISDFQESLRKLGDCQSELDFLEKRLEEKEEENKVLASMLTNLELQLEDKKEESRRKNEENMRMGKALGDCEDKIEKIKKNHAEQRKEWETVYKELFEELKGLKSDMDGMGRRRGSVRREGKE